MAGAQDRSIPDKAASSNSGLKILVVGASNARRFAAELAGMADRVSHVLTNNWRPSKLRVEELAGCVAENVRDKPDAIVFQLLDNILYQGRCLDGSTSLQSKDGDGRFHVEGELILAPKTSQLNIFNMLKPVMRQQGFQAVWRWVVRPGRIWLLEWRRQEELWLLLKATEMSPVVTVRIPLSHSGISPVSCFYIYALSRYAMLISKMYLFKI